MRKNVLVGNTQRRGHLIDSGLDALQEEINLEQKEFVDVDWIHLAQDRMKQWDVIRTELDFGLSELLLKNISGPLS
jgi:hypothetical protein